MMNTTTNLRFMLEAEVGLDSETAGKVMKVLFLWLMEYVFVPEVKDV